MHAQRQDARRVRLTILSISFVLFAYILVYYNNIYNTPLYGAAQRRARPLTTRCRYIRSTVRVIDRSAGQRAGADKCENLEG